MGNAPIRYYFLEDRQKETRKYYNELIEKAELNDVQTKFFDDIRFYMMPASLRNHSNFEGGLVYHSYKMGRMLNFLYSNTVQNKDNLIFNPWKVALCHDVCKTKEYVKLENGSWAYSTDNPFSGHGVASLQICQMQPHNILFSMEESLSITWHMGVYGLESSKDYDTWKRVKRATRCLALSTHYSDDWASTVETELKPKVEKVWED